jgi:hypothetical protein
MKMATLRSKYKPQIGDPITFYYGKEKISGFITFVGEEGLSITSDLMGSPKGSPPIQVRRTHG